MLIFWCISIGLLISYIIVDEMVLLIGSGLFAIASALFGIANAMNKTNKTN